MIKIIKSILSLLTKEKTPVEVQQEKVPSFSLNAETKSEIKTEIQSLTKTFNFNVAGITMKNDEGKDIQKSLQKLAKERCVDEGISFFGGYTAKEIKEEYSLFDGVREFEDLYFTKDEIIFVPEPDNPYDKHAIKVYIDFASERLHIGYVPKKLTRELMDIIDNKKVKSFIGEIVGGKIKSAETDYDGKEKVVTKNLSLGFEITIEYV